MIEHVVDRYGMENPYAGTVPRDPKKGTEQRLPAVPCAQDKGSKCMSCDLELSPDTKFDSGTSWRGVGAG